MHSVTRSSERRPLSLMVRGRVRSRPLYVDLIDISEGGCKIKARPGFAEIGDRVVIKVEGVNAPLGTIAWVRDDTAGVRFEGQMHAAVLDHLCVQHGMKLTTFGNEPTERRL